MHASSVSQYIENESTASGVESEEEMEPEIRSEDDSKAAEGLGPDPLDPKDYQGAGYRALLYICLSIFAAGLVIRYLYIFNWHRMGDYLFSDMDGYYAVCKNFLNPEYVEGMADTVHPPGTKYYFGTLMAIEMWWTRSSLAQPPFGLAMFVQFILSCLVPLMLGGIALSLYGRRTALIVLAIASLYYPLFDYFAYLLSEGPFMFCMVGSFWLLALSLTRTGVGVAVYALFGGVLLGCSAALKSVSMVSAFLVLIALITIARVHGQRWIRPIAAAIIGFLLILTPLSIRATRLSNDDVARKRGEVHFCVIANDAARNILLGHYGDVGSMIFQDSDRFTYFEFGSPSAAQKGYSKKKTWDIGVYENSKLMKVALEWIAANPVEALLLSFEHFFDLGLGTLCWPSSVMHKLWVKAFYYIFLILLLFPALMYIWLNAKKFLTLKPDYCGDLLVFLPLVGISFAAFISLGEPRYRVPYDGFIILLAVRMYLRHRYPENALIKVKDLVGVGDGTADGGGKATAIA